LFGLRPRSQTLVLAKDKVTHCVALIYLFLHYIITCTDKKALRETQTLCAGCSNAEPKIFTPSQTPSRGRRTAKI